MFVALEKSILRPSNVFWRLKYWQDAVEWDCVSMKWGSLLLYLDPLNVVADLKAANGSSPFLLSDLAATFQDVRDEHIIDVVHMFCDTNSVAYFYARLGANCNDTVIWTKLLVVGSYPYVAQVLEVGFESISP